MSVAQSGYLQGLVLLGTLTGSLCGGTLVDWIWRRTGSLRLSRSGVGATFLAACAGLILAAWFVQNAVLAMLLLCGGAFLAALAGPCAFAAAIDIGGTRAPGFRIYEYDRQRGRRRLPHPGCQTISMDLQLESSTAGLCRSLSDRCLLLALRQSPAQHPIYLVSWIAPPIQRHFPSTPSLDPAMLPTICLLQRRLKPPQHSIQRIRRLIDERFGIVRIGMEVLEGDIAFVI